MVFQVAPEFVEYSMLKNVEVPKVVQVIICAVQPEIFSPPLGEVITIGGAVG